jgi:hypothetical protein
MSVMEPSGRNPLAGDCEQRLVLGLAPLMARSQRVLSLHITVPDAVRGIRSHAPRDQPHTQFRLPVIS